MDLIFPLSVVLTNVAAALVGTLAIDVANQLLRGETSLVLQKLSLIAQPARAETPHVEISGRRAGLMGFLMTLFDLSPKVTFTANAKEVRKSAASLSGRSLTVIPLTDQVGVEAECRRNLFWLVAAVLSGTFGVASGLLLGQGLADKMVNALAWVLVAGGYGVAFSMSHSFQLTVCGSLRAGVSFKPSTLEGRMIRFDDVLEAVETILERIQETRPEDGVPQRAGLPVSPAVQWPAVASAGPPVPYVPPTPHQPAPVPVRTPAARASAPQPTPSYQPNVYETAGYALPGAGDFAGLDSGDNSEDTISQPPFPDDSSANVPVGSSSTGTVEFGDEPSAFSRDPELWTGQPEPGTSDSLIVRQSIARSPGSPSETGMFLGLPANLENYDDDESDLDAPDPDSSPANGGTHRGTVSWEEHAENTNDEMRAEAELAELKRSRPKRGEAKLRLRELRRRYPMTEAANKAQRMLERLESGE